MVSGRAGRPAPSPPPPPLPVEVPAPVEPAEVVARIPSWPQAASDASAAARVNEPSGAERSRRSNIALRTSRRPCGWLPAVLEERAGVVVGAALIEARWAGHAGDQVGG